MPDHCLFREIKSADDMLVAAIEHAPSSDIFIGSAAVADYKPIHRYQHKLKKDTGHLKTIKLELNPDIISTIKSQYPKVFCVGFAAETNDILENAKIKLLTKNLNMIIANTVARMPYASFNKTAFGENNEAVILYNGGMNSSDNQLHLKYSSKIDIAYQILLFIIAVQQKIC